jgi:hypothetical protein
MGSARKRKDNVPGFNQAVKLYSLLEWLSSVDVPLLKEYSWTD